MGFLTHGNLGVTKLFSSIHLSYVTCCLMFIIIPTFVQICSVKLVLKLLLHVSVLIHHLQGVYSCVS